MQNKKSIAFLVAGLATVLLSVLRVIVAPTLGVGGGFVSVLLFLLVPLTVAALLFIGPRQPADAMPSGNSLVSFGAVFTGVLSLLFAVWTFLRWKNGGVLPFPSSASPTTLSTVLLVLLCVFALLGGVFFMAQGVSWLIGKPRTAWLSLFSLAPLAWSWVRICQYETSYYSSFNVMRHWYDLAALLLEMLFLLMMVRVVFGTDKQPKLLFPVSLGAGVLLTAACVTRVAMALLGNQEALDNCGLITAPDFGVALLAFGFAKAYVPTKEPAVAVAKTPVTPVATPEEEEEPYEPLLFPLTDSPLVPKDEVEEFDDTPDKPLELEDLILQMIAEVNNEEN